ANPDRPFGELKAIRKFVDLRIGRNDPVDRRIQSLHLHVDFAWDDRDWAWGLAIERELRAPHEDEIRRRIRYWTVNPEDRQLDLLSWLHIPPNHEAISCIPSANHRSPTWAESAGELAVDPDLGVVVD